MKVFTRLIEMLTPPPRWKVPVIIILGAFAGLVAHIFVIAKAPSYLSDNPETCVNCHVMNSYYSTWAHSAHGKSLVCNDCHVPHDNIFHKYLFKAQDGLRHSTIFTLRMEPQVIRIKDAGRHVVQENCERCHEHQVATMRANERLYRVEEEEEDDNGRVCWDCHQETPHGRVNSLASTPYSYAPTLKPILPEWIIKSKQTNNSK